MKRKLRIAADLAQLEAVGNVIVEMLAAFPDVAYDVQLAVHECLTNIIIHAQASVIKIVLKVKNGLFSAELRDDGNGFDIKDIREPDLENGQIHGYGIFLMHQLMDEVRYECKRTGNYWQLSKQLAAVGEA